MHKKRFDPEDDGRVIAPMNVEGMPWYAPRSEASAAKSESSAPPERLSRSETRAAVWGMVKAMLLIGGIFILVYLAFILFCTQVWLK